MGGDDAIDGGVGVTSELVVFSETLGSSVLRVLDEGGKSVGGTDSILAGDDVKRSKIGRSLVDTLCNNRSDELENIGADGASDDVSLSNLVYKLCLVRLGVDGTVICDCVFRCAFDANLDDAV